MRALHNAVQLGVQHGEALQAVDSRSRTVSYAQVHTG